VQAVGAAPDYVTGVLVSATPTSVTISAGPGAPLIIPVLPTTHVCRGPCTHTTSILTPGDVIDAGVDSWSAEGYHAVWIDANLVSDYARIDAIDGLRLMVHSTRHPDQPSPQYTILIEPGTIIEPVTPGDPEVAGQLAWLEPGENIYLTGGTIKPHDMSVVLGSRMFPLLNNDGTIARS
jgi:hypothetical protein